MIARAEHDRMANAIRALAMDAVERAGSGHPGTAMSLAPAAYLLYQKILRHDPADRPRGQSHTSARACSHRV